MKTHSLLLALAAAPAALGHTVWTTWYVDGVSQGDGVAMRMRNDPAKASFPLEDLSSQDMACNVGGTTGVSRVQSVKDGSTLTFEMRSWPDDPSKPSLDSGHKGPCAMYLKKVDSAIKDQGAGDGWFKLFDDGYDKSSDKWCTDKLIANNGRLSVVLPKGLKGGYYLARPEVLALHMADKGDPQFYAGCAQMFLESDGDLAPEETVSIPGYVKAGEPSVSFNIWQPFDSYPNMPGPKVAKLSSGASAASVEKAQTSQTEGLKPEGCIVQNANWCGKEIPSYSDETGCWASDKDCWSQADTCWKSAPVTGNSGCQIWQDKCTANQNQCKSGNFQGPPNKGKDLTPKAETISVGLVMATQGGGVDDSTPQTSAAAYSAAATPKSTPAATSAAAPKSTGGYNDQAAVATPVEKESAAPKKTTITLVSAPGAPAPTAACPAGFECMTAYTTIVETKIEYKTVYADNKRRSLHLRRHRHKLV